MKRIASLVIGIVLIIMLLGFLSIELLESKWFAGWLMEQASTSGNRDITIKENVEIDLGWNPRISLNEIRVANTDWASSKTLLTVEKLSAQLALAKLLRGQVVIPEIIIQKPVVHLEKTKSGMVNWRFSEQQDKSESGGLLIPVIEKIKLTDLSLEYIDSARNLTLNSTIESFIETGGLNQPVTIKATGTYQDESLSLDVTTGTFTEFEESAQFPIKANLQLGSTRSSIKGVISRSESFNDFDLNLSLKGKNLADLFSLTGIPLPPTPAYQFSGKVDRKGSKIKVVDLAGNLGESDVAGKIKVDLGQEPLYFDIKLNSRKLDFKDLSGFTGTTPKKLEEQKTETGLLIPDEPINLTRLNAANGSVTFTADDIISPTIPMSQFTSQLILDEGVLQVSPVTFNMAGGQFTLWLSAYSNKNPIQVDVKTRLKDIRLKEVFKSIENIQKTAGKLDGKSALSGTGNSLREILSNSNGEAFIVMSEGQIDALIMEIIGLDIAEALGLLITGDAPVPIKCAVVDVSIRNGLLQSKTLALNTNDTLIDGKAKFDFSKEALDLTITPYPRDSSLLNLRSQITIDGTLLDPSIGINPLSTLKFIPPFDFGSDKTFQCDKNLQRARDFK